jgi:hypothetical protein
VRKWWIGTSRYTRPFHTIVVEPSISEKKKEKKEEVVEPLGPSQLLVGKVLGFWTTYEGQGYGLSM